MTRLPVVAIDCRLMYYRKAGIAQYARQLVRALCAWRDEARQSEGMPLLRVLLDRRDSDTAWLPAGAGVIRAVTPAHHRYEHLTLPLELAPRRIDVLHSPDFITARGRFRKVITVHDLYFMEHPEVMDAAGLRYYGRIGWSVRRADRIIAVSRFTRDELLRLLPATPPDKISVIHEAASPDSRIQNTEPRRQSTGDRRRKTEPRRQNPEDRARDPEYAIRNTQYEIRNTQHESAPYALFVGTFEPRKNLVTLLSALAAWRDMPADFRLVIVGEQGWAGGDPARLADELGLATRIQFAGRVSDAELDSLYRGARVFVFPSLCEGFGLPVLDAMQRGAPVICSNAGALPEVAGDAALFHDPLDADALAGLLRRAWQDDALRARHAQLGLARAGEFSWRQTAQATWRVYQSV